MPCKFVRSLKTDREGIQGRRLSRMLLSFLYVSHSVAACIQQGIP